LDVLVLLMGHIDGKHLHKIYDTPIMRFPGRRHLFLFAFFKSWINLPTLVSQLKCPSRNLRRVDMIEQPEQSRKDKASGWLLEGNHNDSVMIRMLPPQSVKEITIRGKDDCVTPLCQSDDFRIFRTNHAIDPEINDRVGTLLQQRPGGLWKVLVEQKRHATSS
jgi:hypothetical protein